MNKNASIYKITALALALFLAFSMTTFAASSDEAENQMSFEQAKITKKIKDPIGIAEIEVRSETKADFFALLTGFKS